MKICKIYIKGFQQFQDVELDFTNPETGEPLSKICFIGSNGTGKSKLLSLIKWYLNIFNGGLEASLNSYYSPFSFSHGFLENGKLLFKVLHQSEHYFIFCKKDLIYLIKSDESLILDDDFANKILSDIGNKAEFNDFLIKSTNELLKEEFINRFQLNHNAKDVVIYSPAESSQNGYKDIVDVPVATVSEALSLTKYLPYNSEVSSEYVNVFWLLLVYNLRKRAEEQDEFEKLPENLIRVKQTLIDEFDSFYPKVLEKLGIVWNKILAKAGLYFDIEGASNPYQLNDNLKAYIKIKSTNKVIPYGELSTGIRNYIFRLGHIFSLYFNREIDRAFLLIDEPENSLYPDFLFELIETYQQIIIDKRGQNNTQMFFATHNPIIAAQFKPHERIILEWKEDGTVKANKGITPEGDDPNDILKKDFGLHQLMGPVGIQEWHKYLDLKRKLKATASVEDKMTIASEINKIGQLYNFPA